MKTKIVILFCLFSATAFACDPGYYDVNGTCTVCTSGYYCPGDDIQYQCPSGQDFCDAATAAELDFVRISCEVRSWSSNGGPGALIEHCRARPKITTNCGQYYYSVLYDTANQSYPFNSNLVKYWDNVQTTVGHYLTNRYADIIYYNCNSCTNAPANAHYTDAGIPDVGDCPWACDDGFGKTDDDQCLELYTAGISQLHVDDVTFNIYANKRTSPSLHVKYNDIICYVPIVQGVGTHSLHIATPDGTVYHTIN